VPVPAVLVAELDAAVIVAAPPALDWAVLPPSPLSDRLLVRWSSLLLLPEESPPALALLTSSSLDLPVVSSLFIDEELRASDLSDEAAWDDFDAESEAEAEAASSELAAEEEEEEEEKEDVDRARDVTVAFAVDTGIVVPPGLCGSTLAPPAWA